MRSSPSWTGDDWSMTDALPDFRLEVHLGKWEFTARHHMTASDAESMSLAELLALATDEQRAAFESLSLGYTPTWGTDELRAAVAQTCERVAPEHVLTFAGAQEAIFWALQELVGPGEHALVTVPNYQSMESVTLATGADVEGIVLRPENDWALELDELRALLRPTTRLVAVNFPNNPTGAMPPPDTFRALVELCEERGIRLFSDEIYRGIELDPARTLPQAADLSPSAISLNGMAKAYGLPGLRIGWLACRDRALLERLERRKHYTSICNAGPSEALATLALRNGEAIRARNRAIVAANVPLFEAFFGERWGELFAFAPPQGGCVCFPRFRGDEPVGDFCRRLVEQAGVVLLPADIFDSRLGDVPRDRFRVGLGRRDPQPGLDAFSAFLEQSA
jgi:aspartate/methionine/tyrosine aminotransferase